MARHTQPHRAQSVTRGELAKLAEQELIAGGVPFVEATVVRAQRPTSVRAGDAAIVRSDGTIEGFVGGDCAEASVRLHALRVLETGEPILLRILPGEVEGEPVAGEGAVMVKNPCLSGGGLEIFLEPHLPAATLRVVGESPIALAFADLGRRLGFAVELDAPADSEPRADDAALLVASHGREEERILTAALREGVPYVGLVASQIRGDAVRESLELPEELRAQLHTPAGFEIGARTPEEIALAVLAEIVALRRSPGDAPRGGPIAAIAAERRDEAIAPTSARAATSTEVALDPLCGMEVAVSAASIQLEQDGERHYFCSEGCRDRFAAEGLRMPAPAERFVTGLVLAAGGSRRLGEPKQLLPYGSGTLLDHALETARASGFDQLIVALGGSSNEVRDRVDLSGTEVVENPDYGEGCSSSIAAGLSVVDPRAEVLVLMLGDQPGVTAATVRALIAGSGEGAALAVCRYDDGRGHPLAISRSLFGELRELHGDKAVWKLLDRRAPDVVEVPVPGPIPPDVDTRADYEAIMAAAGASS